MPLVWLSWHDICSQNKWDIAYNVFRCKIASPKVTGTFLSRFLKIFLSSQKYFILFYSQTIKIKYAHKSFISQSVFGKSQFGHLFLSFFKKLFYFWNIGFWKSKLLKYVLFLSGNYDIFFCFSQMSWKYPKNYWCLLN